MHACNGWMSKAKCEWRQISMDRTRADGEPAKEKERRRRRMGGQIMASSVELALV